jgi:hypothetical protein
VGLPQLDVDFTLKWLLYIGEERVVVLLQADLHLVVAAELDETSSHELFCAFVCAHADVDGFDLFEMLLELFLRGAVGKVA